MAAPVQQRAQQEQAADTTTWRQHWYRHAETLRCKLSSSPEETSSAYQAKSTHSYLAGDSPDTDDWKISARMAGHGMHKLQARQYVNHHTATKSQLVNFTKRHLSTVACALGLKPYHLIDPWESDKDKHSDQDQASHTASSRSLPGSTHSSRQPVTQTYITDMYATGKVAHHHRPHSATTTAMHQSQPSTTIGTAAMNTGECRCRACRGRTCSRASMCDVLSGTGTLLQDAEYRRALVAGDAGALDAATPGVIDAFLDTSHFNDHGHSSHTHHTLRKARSFHPKPRSQSSPGGHRSGSAVARQTKARLEQGRQTELGVKHTLYYNSDSSSSSGSNSSGRHGEIVHAQPAAPKPASGAWLLAPRVPWAPITVTPPVTHRQLKPPPSGLQNISTSTSAGSSQPSSDAHVMQELRRKAAGQCLRRDMKPFIDQARLHRRQQRTSHAASRSTSKAQSSARHSRSAPLNLQRTVERALKAQQGSGQPTGTAVTGTLTGASNRMTLCARLAQQGSTVAVRATRQAATAGGGVSLSFSALRAGIRSVRIKGSREDRRGSTEGSSGSGHSSVEDELLGGRDRAATAQLPSRGFITQVAAERRVDRFVKQAKQQRHNRAVPAATSPWLERKVEHMLLMQAAAEQHRLQSMERRVQKHLQHHGLGSDSSSTSL